MLGISLLRLPTKDVANRIDCLFAIPAECGCDYLSPLTENEALVGRALAVFLAGIVVPDGEPKKLRLAIGKQ
jgi:hypothetical protein